MNKPLMMGILNVTPDSFSDGGLYLTPEAALKRAEMLVAEGADVIDIGGESSRPGAPSISAQEEMDRVIPVFEKLSARIQARLSIDTVKPEVAKEAVNRGATIINDISAGADVRMGEIVKQSKADIILMHMRGTPVSMQVQPIYPRGVVGEVRDFLMQRVQAFQELGVPAENLWVDPGIGFGKTPAQNLELLYKLDEFKGIGGRVVVGTSRKSFLAHLLGNGMAPFEERLAGTIATNLWAATRGASVFRVHDVGECKRALKTWFAIENAGQ